MNWLVLIILAFAASAASQDVSVPNDLLGSTTKASSTSDVEYSEEVTEDTTELNWVAGTDDNGNLPPPDSLIRPPFPLPPFQSNCTILLPPNFYPSTQAPIIIPPILNSTVDPVEREETVVCPVGSTQIGSVCNVTYSNECPDGYTFNGERCVIKYTDCPLNFELNEFGRCVQRQICPRNHNFENGRCRPITQCPPEFRWNGERCEVSNIQCQRGFVLRGSECVDERFTCPIGFDEYGDECVSPKPECPAGYEIKSDGFCSRVTLRCRSGSSMINGECRRTILTCPDSSYKVGDECHKIQTERPPTCPIGFYLANNMCYLIPTDRPEVEQDLVCPPGTYKNGNACYLISSSTKRPTTCPPGFYRDGSRCLEIQTKSPPVTYPPPEEVECPIGTHRVGDVCYRNVPELSTERPILCQPGYYRAGSRCLEIQTKSPPVTYPPPEGVECPIGSHRVGDVCYQNVTEPPSTDQPILCPSGYYRSGNQCFAIVVPSTTPKYGSTTPRTVSPTTPFYPNPNQQCPDGFVLHNNQCYRCPPNFDLCENKCVRNNVGCGQSHHPNININIYTRDQRATGKGYNIINQVEPINNTIINFNNVTHPVTLNNVNENNIYIYSETQCPDGSIRTVIVKNNETINGCIDIESDKNSDGSKPSVIDDDGTDANEDSGKCCEVVTPRQCKKRDSNQWICTHRRYKYCGKFCIADRLYLKPPATSYNNQILTIVPSQPVHNAPPCFGRSCPPVGE
jgi:hypothetical protein